MLIKGFSRSNGGLIFHTEYSASDGTAINKLTTDDITKPVEKLRIHSTRTYSYYGGGNVAKSEGLTTKKAQLYLSKLGIVTIGQLMSLVYAFDKRDSAAWSVLAGGATSFWSGLKSVVAKIAKDAPDLLGNTDFKPVVNFDLSGIVVPVSMAQLKSWRSFSDAEQKIITSEVAKLLEREVPTILGNASQTILEARIKEKYTELEKLNQMRESVAAEAKALEKSAKEDYTHLIRGLDFFHENR
jgi:adenine deaminase